MLMTILVRISLLIDDVRRKDTRRQNDVSPTNRARFHAHRAEGTAQMTSNVTLQEIDIICSRRGFQQIFISEILLEVYYLLIAIRFFSSRFSRRSSCNDLYMTISLSMMRNRSGGNHNTVRRFMFLAYYDI